MLLTGTRVGEFFKKNNYPCLFRVLSLDKETDQRTSEMIDLLLNHPLVVAKFSGHNHLDQTVLINGKTHYSTSALYKSNCRYIEIK